MSPCSVQQHARFIAHALPTLQRRVRLQATASHGERQHGPGGRVQPPPSCRAPSAAWAVAGWKLQGLPTWMDGLLRWPTFDVVCRGSCPSIIVCGLQTRNGEEGSLGMDATRKQVMPTVQAQQNIYQHGQPKSWTAGRRHANLQHSAPDPELPAALQAHPRLLPIPHQEAPDAAEGVNDHLALHRLNGVHHHCSPMWINESSCEVQRTAAGAAPS